MKLNNFKFIILIKLLIIFNIVNSQTISQLSSTAAYSKYLNEDSNYGYCNYDDDILILINGTSETSESSFNILNYPGQTTSIHLLKTSDFASLYSFKFSQVPLGEFENIRLSFTISSGSYPFTLNKLTCKIIDQSSLKYSIVNEISNAYSQAYGGYYGVFKVEGLEYYTNLGTASKNVKIINITPRKNNIISSSSSTPQLFMALFTTIPSNPLDTWDVIIKNNSNSNLPPIKFKSPITLFNSDNSIQIKYLNDPLNKLNSLITLIPITQSSKPMLLLTLNKSIQSNPVIPITLSSDNGQFIFIPINGSVDTTNTINYLLYLNGIGENNISIASQYYSTYKQSNLSFNINDYTYKSYGVSNYGSDGEFVEVSLDILNSFSSSPAVTLRLTGDSITRKLEFDYPFGFTFGQSSSSKFEVSYPQTSLTNLIFHYSLFYENLEIKAHHESISSIDTSKLPNFISITYSLLNDNRVVFRFILDNPDTLEFLVNDKYYHAATCLIFNDTVSPTYEIIIDYNKKSSIYIIVQNHYLRYTNYTTDFPLKIPDSTNQNNLEIFRSPLSFFNFTEFDSSDIKSISFLYNDIDTTDESYWNTMYLELINSGLSKGTPILITFYFSNTKEESIFYLYWDRFKLQYKCDFKIPANILLGSVEYSISMQTRFISSLNLPPSFQLRVYSKNADLMGPVFTTFTKIESKILLSQQVNFGWTFTIQDKVNGFKSGYIVVMGEMDKTVYNITLSTTSLSFKSGDKYEGVYQVIIQESSIGITQTYRVTDVYLEDLQNQKTKFKYIGVGIQSYPQLNPFINFANIQDLNFLTINVTKTAIITSAQVSDLIQLKYLNVESLLVESSSPTTNYKVSFSIYDPTGLKQSQSPSVYITSFSTDALKFSSSLSNSSDGLTVNFTSIIQIPSSFGFPYPLFINIYGFVNNLGYYGGFTSKQIASKGYINKIESTSPDLKTYVTLTDVKYSNGEFNIFGRGLSRVVIINIGGVNLKCYSHFSALYVDYDLESTISTYDPVEIIIYGITNQGVNTNSIVLTFTKKLFKVPPTNPLLPPVNPPQKCLGNPECGGPNQGICTINGCSCYSPYVGNDCTSKVVTVPPPIIDKDRPNTTIEVPVENSNDNVQSIVTVVGLREVDLITNQEIQYHPLNNWVYSKKENSNVALYESSITKNGLKTNVNVTLEWFTKESSVLFANQNLTMLPSSIKYTISLSQYSFSNNFASLQVIMLAQIQSSNNDICSNKEFGNTTNGDNSNFIKLQVDKNSFYGRFIKRGIIDSQIRGVENVLLDLNFNSINSTNNKQQSYIGIIVPRYMDSVILDPDFSNLLDIYSASGLCKNGDSNGLSKGAIIGIVVGIVGGAILITISILLVIKYKYQLKNIKNNIKLKKMNNSL